MPYQTILYEKKDRIARITLNRPEKLNAINQTMINELEQAVVEANADPEVRVIILKGAGRAFCAGFDLTGLHDGARERPAPSGHWDPFVDYMWTTDTCAKWMSMWRGRKPVIAQVHGWCIAGGTDMVLCADMIVAAEDARIGYPPARVWGSPTSFMWIYRLGVEWAKRLMLTGDNVDGKTAERIGLIGKAVPADKLEEEVESFARRMAQLPLSQLVSMKLIINQAYENMGLYTTQLLGSIMDGIMRNTPEGLAFAKSLREKGVRASVGERDGPFGDYGSAPPSGRPGGV